MSVDEHDDSEEWVLRHVQAVQWILGTLAHRASVTSEDVFEFKNVREGDPFSDPQQICALVRAVLG